MISKIIGKEDFQGFEKKYKSLLKSDVVIIDKVINYLRKKRGKFIRPALTINVAKSLGCLSEKNYTVASLIEMIHLATLLHDDIVDHAETRRGWPTVGRVWKNKVSLLVGDYIFSKSLSATIELNDLESIKILSETSDRLSKGEIFQIQESKKKIMTEKKYYSMIKDKTASLFSAACELSARSSSEKTQDFENFKNFGENFGIAYQIKDDMNDILGSKTMLGKPVMLDVKRNTLTLPYIHCLNQLSETDKKEFIFKLKRLSRKGEKREIVSMVRDLKGLDYCEDMIRYHLKVGLDFIQSYPHKENFINLIDLIFGAKKK